MDINKVLLAGESQTVEFKTSFNNEVIESLVAFANAQGGTVYVGVSDAGKVVGVDISKESVVQWINEIKTKTLPMQLPDVERFEIGGESIIALSITEYPIKPVSTKGKYYKRVGNSNQLLMVSEVSDMYLRSINTSWDACIDPQHTLNDLDLIKVQHSIEWLKKEGITIDEDPVSFLIKKGLNQRK